MFNDGVGGRWIPVLILGAIGWALCGSVIGIGRNVTTMQNTLIAHAVAAPIIFGVIAYLYFGRWGHVGPVQTAATFVGIVIFLDVFVVALLVERSFEMFGSLLGTWIPWVLIFAATWLVGRQVYETPDDVIPT
jgi:hypothetical protein